MYRDERELCRSAELEGLRSQESEDRLFDSLRRSEGYFDVRQGDHFVELGIAIRLYIVNIIKRSCYKGEL